MSIGNDRIEDGGRIHNYIIKSEEWLQSSGNHIWS